MEFGTCLVRQCIGLPIEKERGGWNEEGGEEMANNASRNAMLVCIRTPSAITNRVVWSQSTGLPRLTLSGQKVMSGRMVHGTRNLGSCATEAFLRTRVQ